VAICGIRVPYWSPPGSSARYGEEKGGGTENHDEKGPRPHALRSWLSRSDYQLTAVDVAAQHRIEW